MIVMADDKRVKYAIQLTGKYSKQLLFKLEAHYEVEQLSPELRKFVLDAFNDLAREQEKVLLTNT